MATASADIARAQSPGGYSVKPMVALVIVVYFTGGIATVLVDTLVPKLKGLFALTYTEAMLTQFCFFLAYFLVSIPGGMLVARIGYIRSIVVGLLLVASGCLLFAPAAAAGVYPGFLLALFVMAGGITTFQIAANPFIASLGSPKGSHSRLTLALGFNSLGYTIGPLIGAAFILSGNAIAPGNPQTAAPAILDHYRRAEAHVVQGPFLVIAAVLLGVAAVFWTLRRRDLRSASTDPNSLQALSLLRRPRFVMGVVTMFAYVGAEVSVGSILTNYLMLDKTLHVDAPTAGRLAALFWGGAMVGRFIGSLVLTRVRPGVMLCMCALAASVLAVTSVATFGVFAGVAIIGIGLFNSIMFPTIFTLAIEELGEQTAKGSGLVCMAVVGGAVVPLATGAVADGWGLSFAPLVPALCYSLIAIYGFVVSRGGASTRVLPA
jgi:MFS transporter, FHS family, L-fucose permease